MRPVRVTLEDVAREAGISKSIASRVLNGHPGLSVRPATRSRVVETASRLGYRPHAAARGLRRAETGAIGLLIPDLTQAVYARIVRGAFERAREREFAVLLAEDMVEGTAEPMLARLVQQGRVDGLILASSRLSHPLLGTVARHGIPHVFANRAVPGTNRNVVMRDDLASAAAVDHLADLGHRRVAHIAGPLGLDTARRRERAFRRRAAERGLDALVAESHDFGEVGGAAAATELLRADPGLTALYTSTLNQAVGALDAAWRLGRRVPDDLSLVTYDDMPLAEYLRPPLTTVLMPLAELGAAAVDALIDQLGGAAPRDVVVEQAPQVIVRGSTAACG